MKATFEDFLAEHPLCKKFEGNTDAIAVFDFLSEDENLIAMLDVSDVGKPALLGCLKELEDFYDGLINTTFSFDDKFVRSTVGRMVATIVAPFGYFPVAQVNFSQTNKGRYFGSANRYEKKGRNRMYVSKTIKRFPIDKRQVNTFLAEMAGNPLRKEHMFISAFLKMMDEENDSMVASITGVKDKFKELLSAKGEKKKDKKFEETWRKLSFTVYSHMQPSSFPESIVTLSSESDVFPYGTIFEIFTDLRSYIDDITASDIIDNYCEQTAYEQSLHGAVFYLRVSDFYYESLTKYVDKFNYDACLRECEEYKQMNDDED